jgi:hypothetical protein
MTVQGVWKDPVGAGIISGVVVAILVSAAGKLSPANAAVFLKSFPIPVWVIIIAVFTLIGTLYRLITHREPPPSIEPYNFKTKIASISMVAEFSPPEEKHTYPLKCRVWLRNESKGCIDVMLLRYEPDKIHYKLFRQGVLQIELAGGAYIPVDHGADRIAVLPEQNFRVWIAIDEMKYSQQEVQGAYGQVGTLVFKVNGEEERVKF